MSILDAIIQGIIQGLTEFLPVSSSGHLKLYQAITGQSVEEGTFLLVILHLGTLVAVCIAFWDTILALLKAFCGMMKDIFTGKFRWKEMDADRRMLVMLVISLVLLVPFYLIKEIFENKSPDDFDEETLMTINKFFENSLNVSETSRQLYIHRNTLVYRLDKLQKSTGLDLRVFEDAITFKIALMVVKYMKYMESLEY